MKLFERMLSRPTASTNDKATHPDNHKAPVKHMLLRFSDNLLKGKPGTIASHAAVVKRKGYVWYGKYGSPLSEKYIAYLKKETAPVFAFFFKRMGGWTKPSIEKSELFRGRILAATNEDVRLTVEKKYVPKYYDELSVSIGFWLKITDIENVGTSFLEKLSGSSSGAPIMESISSSNGLIFVCMKD